MLARLWEWWPVLELEKGQTYRLHLSAADWQHGFSLQPININIQVHPGLEHVITMTHDRAAFAGGLRRGRSRGASGSGSVPR